MATKPLTYVVPIDFTSSTENALKFALEVASGHEAQLILLHIISDYKDRIGATQRLNELIRLNQHDKVTMEARVVTGKVLSDIGMIAESLDAQLIVMGTHGLSMLGKIFGSKALEVVKHSKVPLILLQEGSKFHEINSIAMTIDLSRESIQVVKAASSLSKLLNAKVTLIGQHYNDAIFMKKIDVNLRVANDYLLQHGVETKIELLSEVHFIENLIQYCKENNVDMIAATYYEETFSLFSTKLIDTLANNALKIPVLTFDGEDTSSGTPFGFITQ